MKRKYNTRSVMLIIIFVLIVLCSLVSLSYAYYSSSASNYDLFGTHSVTAQCLNITSGSETNSLPSSPYPVDNATALSSTDGDVYGIYSVRIQNNCSETVNIDIVFVPQTLNSISLESINYAYCQDTSASCESSWSSKTPYYLGYSTTCYTTSTNPSGFWNYMASDNGLGGSDQRMCSVISQPNNGYLSIAANSYKWVTIKYWVGSGTSDKTVNGVFVTYTPPIW